MRLYPPEDWLAASIPRKFDSEFLSRAAHQLTPDTVRIFWHSKQFQDIATEVEPWYGTPYTCQKIDQALIEQWRSPEVDPRLHLPERNPFIPTDFSIVKDPDPEVQFPSILKKTDLCRLWYKLDSGFGFPKACIVLHFHCPESLYSPEASLLTRLFTELLKDYLDASAYDAVVAGLCYQIVDSSRGFWISVSGYNHELIRLITRIMEVVIDFTVDEDRFNVKKEVLLRSCLNVQFEQPQEQAHVNRVHLLQHRRWHVNDYIQVLPSLQPDDLRQMFPRILSRTFVECFVSGNISSEEAESFVDHVEAILTKGPTVRAKPLLSSQLVEHRIVRLADGADFNFPSVGLNPKDQNSALRFYLQFGQDETSMNVLIDLLVLTMNEGVFHQLRTVEQLGYFVFVTGTDDSGVRGLEFLIQSPSRIQSHWMPGSKPTWRCLQKLLRNCLKRTSKGMWTR
ncbi:hypothetical protein Mapa_007625 [Marchantia paleacea]|nr:hypothetical protein Mapa_007625 [Marchantia paleacea]